MSSPDSEPNAFQRFIEAIKAHPWFLAVSTLAVLLAGIASFFDTLESLSSRLGFNEGDKADSNLKTIVAADDDLSISEDTVSAIDVLANDVVPADSSSLRVTLETEQLKGRVRLNSDRTIRYEPPADFHGRDTFSYTVKDTAGSASASVRIDVSPVNDPPRAATTQWDLKYPADSFRVFSALAGATDPESDPIRLQSGPDPSLRDVAKPLMAVLGTLAPGLTGQMPVDTRSLEAKYLIAMGPLVESALEASETPPIKRTYVFRLADDSGATSNHQLKLQVDVPPVKTILMNCTFKDSRPDERPKRVRARLESESGTLLTDASWSGYRIERAQFGPLAEPIPFRHFNAGLTLSIEHAAANRFQLKCEPEAFQTTGHSVFLSPITFWGSTRVATGQSTSLTIRPSTQFQQLKELLEAELVGAP